MRQISGLRWARASSRPPGMPIGRPRGAKLAGVRYEQALAEALPQATHGQWWEFEDQHGHGWCQTDLIADCAGSPVVLEVKYSWVPEAHRQLSGLYLPVARMALERPVIGLVVVKRLIAGIPKNVAITGSMSEALTWAWAGVGPVVLHWLGGSLSQLERRVA